jgi:hypothetical protein
MEVTRVAQKNFSFSAIRQHQHNSTREIAVRFHIEEDGRDIKGAQKVEKYRQLSLLHRLVLPFVASESCKDLPSLQLSFQNAATHILYLCENENSYSITRMNN